MSGRHFIDEAVFDISFASREAAREQEAGLGAFIRDRLLPLADEVFSEFSGEAADIRLDRLEIDLGDVAYAGFQDEMENRFKERLRSILRDKLHAPETVHAPGGGAVRLPRDAAGKLGFFLETGRLERDSGQAQGVPLEEWLRQALQTERQALVQFLRNTPHRGIVAARLARQFSEPLLAQLVDVLAPSHGSAVARLLDGLGAAWQTEHARAISWSRARVAIWERLFYAYLKPGVDSRSPEQVFAKAAAEVVEGGARSREASGTDRDGHDANPLAPDDQRAAPPQEAAANPDTGARLHAALASALAQGDARELAGMWDDAKRHGALLQEAIHVQLSSPEQQKAAAAILPENILLDMARILAPSAAPLLEKLGCHPGLRRDTARRRNEAWWSHALGYLHTRRATAFDGAAYLRRLSHYLEIHEIAPLPLLNALQAMAGEETASAQHANGQAGKAGPASTEASRGEAGTPPEKTPLLPDAFATQAGRPPHQLAPLSAAAPALPGDGTPFSAPPLPKALPGDDPNEAGRNREPGGESSAEDGALALWREITLLAASAPDRERFYGRFLERLLSGQDVSTALLALAGENDAVPLPAFDAAALAQATPLEVAASTPFSGAVAGEVSAGRLLALLESALARGDAQELVGIWDTAKHQDALLREAFGHWLNTPERRQRAVAVLPENILRDWMRAVAPTASGLLEKIASLPGLSRASSPARNEAWWRHVLDFLHASGAAAFDVAAYLDSLLSELDRLGVLSFPLLSAIGALAGEETGLRRVPVARTGGKRSAASRQKSSRLAGGETRRDVSRLLDEWTAFLALRAHWGSSQDENAEAFMRGVRQQGAKAHDKSVYFRHVEERLLHGLDASAGAAVADGARGRVPGSGVVSRRNNHAGPEGLVDARHPEVAGSAGHKTENRLEPEAQDEAAVLRLRLEAALVPGGRDGMDGIWQELAALPPAAVRRCFLPLLVEGQWRGRLADALSGEQLGELAGWLLSGQESRFVETLAHHPEMRTGGENSAFWQCALAYFGQAVFSGYERLGFVYGLVHHLADIHGLPRERLLRAVCGVDPALTDALTVLEMATGFHEAESAPEAAYAAATLNLPLPGPATEREEAAVAESGVTHGPDTAPFPLCDARPRIKALLAERHGSLGEDFLREIEKHAGLADDEQRYYQIVLEKLLNHHVVDLKEAAGETARKSTGEVERASPATEETAAARAARLLGLLESALERGDAQALARIWPEAGNERGVIPEFFRRRMEREDARVWAASAFSANMLRDMARHAAPAIAPVLERLGRFPALDRDVSRARHEAWWSYTLGYLHGRETAGMDPAFYLDGLLHYLEERGLSTPQLKDGVAAIGREMAGLTSPRAMDETASGEAVLAAERPPAGSPEYGWPGNASGEENTARQALQSLVQRTLGQDAPAFWRAVEEQSAKAQDKAVYYRQLLERLLHRPTANARAEGVAEPVSRAASQAGETAQLAQELQTRLEEALAQGDASELSLLWEEARRGGALVPAAFSGSLDGAERQKQAASALPEPILLDMARMLAPSLALLLENLSRHPGLSRETFRARHDALWRYALDRLYPAPAPETSSAAFVDGLFQYLDEQGLASRADLNGLADAVASALPAGGGAVSPVPSREIHRQDEEAARQALQAHIRHRLGEKEAAAFLRVVEEDGAAAQDKARYYHRVLNNVLRPPGGIGEEATNGQRPFRADVHGGDGQTGMDAVERGEFPAIGGEAVPPPVASAEAAGRQWADEISRTGEAPVAPTGIHAQAAPLPQHPHVVEAGMPAMGADPGFSGDIHNAVADARPPGEAREQGVARGKAHENAERRPATADGSKVLPETAHGEEQARESLHAYAGRHLGGNAHAFLKAVEGQAAKARDKAAFYRYILDRLARQLDVDLETAVDESAGGGRDAAALPPVPEARAGQAVRKPDIAVESAAACPPQAREAVREPVRDGVPERPRQAIESGVVEGLAGEALLQALRSHIERHLGENAGTFRQAVENRAKLARDQERYYRHILDHLLRGQNVDLDAAIEASQSAAMDAVREAGQAELAREEGAGTTPLAVAQPEAPPAVGRPARDGNAPEEAPAPGAENLLQSPPASGGQAMADAAFWKAIADQSAKAQDKAAFYRHVLARLLRQPGADAAGEAVAVPVPQAATDLTQDAGQRNPPGAADAIAFDNANDAPLPEERLAARRGEPPRVAVPGGQTSESEEPSGFSTYFGKSAPREMETAGDIFVGNAGLVLATPYLPQLFRLLNLMEGTAFKDGLAVERAIHLLQFVADERCDAPEPLLVLNKILCGVPTVAPVIRSVEVLAQEKETIEGMLKAIIQNWTILGNTSVQGLRESFLQRNGRLRLKEEGWHLEVEQKGIDVLLDRLPWSFSVIKHPWMAMPVFVEWR